MLYLFFIFISQFKLFSDDLKINILIRRSCIKKYFKFIIFSIVFILTIALFENPSWAINATIGKVTIKTDHVQNGKKGILIEASDIKVSGRKGKKVYFGCNVSQYGKWIPGHVLWRATGHLAVPYDPSVWKGQAAWFFYAYDDLKKHIKMDVLVWFSVMVVNSDNIQDIIQKDASITLGNVGGSSSSPDELLAEMEGDYGKIIKNKVNIAISKLTGPKIAKMTEPAIDGIFETAKKQLIKAAANGKVYDKKTLLEFKKNIIESYKAKLIEMGLGQVSGYVKDIACGNCETFLKKTAQKAGANLSNDIIKAKCDKYWDKIQGQFVDLIKDKILNPMINKLKAKIDSYWNGNKDIIVKKDAGGGAKLVLSRKSGSFLYFVVQSNSKASFTLMKNSGGRWTNVTRCPSGKCSATSWNRSSVTYKAKAYDYSTKQNIETTEVTVGTRP